MTAETTTPCTSAQSGRLQCDACEDSVPEAERSIATYRWPAQAALVQYVADQKNLILVQAIRFIYNDLQGRNQKEAVHHIAEQGLAARKGWTLAAPRPEVGGLQHPPGTLNNAQLFRLIRPKPPRRSLNVLDPAWLHGCMAAAACKHRTLVNVELCNLPRDGQLHPLYRVSAKGTAPSPKQRLIP